MRRRFLPYLLIFCAIIAFLLGNTSVRSFCSEITHPFQRVFGRAEAQVTSRLSAAWRGLCDGPMRDTSATEIDRLRVMLLDAEVVARENDQLREALNWIREQPFSVIAAPVWSHGGGLGAWPKLRLAAGSRHGIRPGDTVLVPEGLVGRIDENVSLNTCDVILLSDPACRVAAEVIGGAKGIVQGAQGIDFGTNEEEPLLYATHPLQMRFIARNVALQAGQHVFTEGSGGLFPRGFKIGTITERHEDPADLLAEVLIEPAVDPTTLKTVFILTHANRSEESTNHAH